MKLFPLTALALLAAFATAPASAAPAEAGPLAPHQVYALPTDPVSGEPLAGVDAPVQRMHDDRQFLFASEDSAEEFEADPSRFVPAVDEKLTQTQREGYPMETCPITGEPLTAMGEPVETLIGHRLVKLCCAGCLDKASADPEATLAKLDAAVVAQQGPGYAAETCPVTGMKLDAMGGAIDAVYAGPEGATLVRFCCGGCPPKFAQNPAKHLAELNGAQG